MQFFRFESVPLSCKLLLWKRRRTWIKQTKSALNGVSTCLLPLGAHYVKICFSNRLSLYDSPLNALPRTGEGKFRKLSLSGKTAEVVEQKQKRRKYLHFKSADKSGWQPVVHFYLWVETDDLSRLVLRPFPFKKLMHLLLLFC